MKLLTSDVNLNDSSIVNINTLSLEDISEPERIGTEKAENLRELIEYFDNSFVAEEAWKSGKILPLPGVDKDYDRAKEEMREVEESLEDYLSDQKRRINNKNMKYWYSGKMRFQIEVNILSDRR